MGEELQILNMNMIPKRKKGFHTLKMNTVDSSETLVPIYRTALQHIPKTVILETYMVLYRK
jgi:hypothetical protein